MEHMKINRQRMCRMIDAAMHRIPADLVIRNCNVVDVYTGTIRRDSIAIADGMIVGFGDDYRGQEEIDAKGSYATPGLIDSHIHIESSYTSPEEFGRMVVPHGTTTVVADPHEIVNVCGLDGFNYMVRAAQRTPLTVRFMVPSCVPATNQEDSGAVLNAFDMQWPLGNSFVSGLGEFMNYPGIINKDEDALDKLLEAQNANKVIDGHSPALKGAELNAYAASGVKTDHECTNTEEMVDRLQRGMYVQMRDGSACHDLKNLIPAITPFNYKRCLLCSDDRQPRTILEEGHIDNHLRMLVRAGIDPVMAISMATLNCAECYKLEDRGALAPGKRADIVLFEDLADFRAKMVFIEGKKVAEAGEYLLPVEKAPITSVRGSVHVRPFTADQLRMHLRSDRVRAIGIVRNGVITRSEVVSVRRDADGDFVFDPSQPVVKVAVLERHHNTGKIGLGLLKNYGIRRGAIALSVAHDSHNILCVGVSNGEMYAAIQALIEQEGGFVLVEGGKVVASLPLPIAGLMSDQPGEVVAERLRLLHEAAHEQLGISRDVEPVMTLCFMSLIVIPELKITTRGLFDVTRFDFVPIEAD